MVKTKVPTGLKDAQLLERFETGTQKKKYLSFAAETDKNQKGCNLFWYSRASQPISFICYIDNKSSRSDMIIGTSPIYIFRIG